MLCAEEGDLKESFIPKYSVGDVYGAWNGEVDFEDQAGGVSLWEAGVKFSLPVADGEGWRVTAGVNYKVSGLEVTGGGFPGGDANFDLHRLEVPVDLWLGGEGKWKFWLRVSPGVASDFEEIEGGDFSYSTLALASYQWTPTVSVAVGGYYSNDLGESRLLPAIGFVWEPNRNWSVALTAPRVQVAYAPNGDWLFALRAFPSGGGWRVDGAGKNAGQRVDLNYSSVRVGLGVERRIGDGPVWLYVDGGMRFAQSLEIEGGKGRRFEEDLEAGVSVIGGLKLRF